MTTTNKASLAILVLASLAVSVCSVMLYNSKLVAPALVASPYHDHYSAQQKKGVHAKFLMVAYGYMKRTPVSVGAQDSMPLSVEVGSSLVFWVQEDGVIMDFSSNGGYHLLPVVVEKCADPEGTACLSFKDGGSASGVIYLHVNGKIDVDAYGVVAQFE